MDTPPTPDASDSEDNVSVYWAPRHSPIHEVSGSPTSVPLTDSPWDERTPLVGMPTNGKVALAALLEQIERQYIQRPAAMSSVPPISTWPSDVQIDIIGCSIGGIIDDAICNVMSRAKAL